MTSSDNLAWFGLGFIGALCVIAAFCGRRQVRHGTSQDIHITAVPVEVTERPRSHFLARMERQITFPN